MTEIELKAHVYDREKLIAMLNSFAEYQKTVTKNDTYFHLQKTDGKKNEEANKKNYISARIRIQTEKTKSGIKTLNFLTYKRKENKTDENGISIEVNDEKESEISSTEAIEALFADAGFVPALKKKKEVMIFSAETECGKATLELCNVEKLGDFIEIEILSGTNNAETTEKIQSELKRLLSRCEIPEKDIESRYYSEMLNALSENQN